MNTNTTETTVQLNLTLRELAFFKAIAEETLLKVDEVLVSHPDLKEAIDLRHTAIITLTKLDFAIERLEV